MNGRTATFRNKKIKKALRKFKAFFIISRNCSEIGRKLVVNFLDFSRKSTIIRTVKRVQEISKWQKFTV